MILCKVKIIWSYNYIVFELYDHITYLLTPWNRVLVEKLTGFQLVKKFPAFYGTGRLITACKNACHLSKSWAQSNNPGPSLTVWMFRNDKFLWWDVVSTLSNPQAGRPPIVCCMWLLIQYIHSYPPHWRMFLHPKPEDILCCGDTDPLMMDDHITVGNVIQL
jgi:hypothetical protein